DKDGHREADQDHVDMRHRGRTQDLGEPDRDKGRATEQNREDLRAVLHWSGTRRDNGCSAGWIQRNSSASPFPSPTPRHRLWRSPSFGEQDVGILEPGVIAMSLAEAVNDQGASARGLYEKLEDRVLARDQVGASESYYQLVRDGRPLPEMLREAVR